MIREGDGTKMHEVMELPESHQQHGDDPLVVRVSLTISILAVFLAFVTVLGHRAHTEELLLQIQASDKWAQYQAKSIRLHETQGFADILSTLPAGDKDKADGLREKYAKEVEHYKGDKEDISGEAKRLEGERDLTARKADRFDVGESFIEMGLVICPITLLTKRRRFWIGGSVIAAVGIALALTAFLLH